MLPPYQCFETPAGHKVGLIGVVTDTTPTIVSPKGITDVEFIDEAEAVNRWVPELWAQGIEAIGVLVHEGGTITDPADLDDINECTGPGGDIVDINAGVSADVDLIVSAQPHPVQLPPDRPRRRSPDGHPGRLLRTAHHRHPAGHRPEDR